VQTARVFSQLYASGPQLEQLSWQVVVPDTQASSLRVFSMLVTAVQDSVLRQPLLFRQVSRQVPEPMPLLAQRPLAQLSLLVQAEFAGKPPGSGVSQNNTGSSAPTPVCCAMGTSNGRQESPLPHVAPPLHTVGEGVSMQAQNELPRSPSRLVHAWPGEHGPASQEFTHRPSATPGGVMQTPLPQASWLVQVAPWVLRATQLATPVAIEHSCAAGQTSSAQVVAPVVPVLPVVVPLVVVAVVPVVPVPTVAVVLLEPCVPLDPLPLPEPMEPEPEPVAVDGCPASPARQWLVESQA